MAVGLKQVYGQLIFSGYDASRFTENSVSFTMADDLTRDLVVGLQSISYSGSTSNTLLSDAIDIYIDSTDPNLWLPEEVCDAFEEAFDLELDEDTGLYLVNETQRNVLLDTDAEVTFRLSDDKSGGDTVSITFPYAAFDLKAESPLVENGSYYFPLKRAANSTQYTLGRVFLQEAYVLGGHNSHDTWLTYPSYLSADYERKVFNVSACTWNSGAERDVVMIPSIGSGSSDGGDGSSDQNGSGSGLSGGEIAGIVVGAVGGAILLAALAACLFLRRRRRSKQRAYEVKDLQAKPGMTMIGGPAQHSSMPYSSADVSGWTPSTDSPPQPVLAGTAGSSSTPELDGRQTHATPDTEIDGKEIREGKHPVAKNAGVYELAGSHVGDRWSGRPATKDVAPDTSTSSPSAGSTNVSDESPPSPYVSTIGTTWGQETRPVSDMVSPVTAPKYRPHG